MKYISAILLFALAIAAAPKKAQPKPDPYDPDKLRPLEHFCGRPTHPKNSECSCMKSRNEAAEKARVEKCGHLPEGLQRAKCEVLINPCDMKVIDHDSPSYTPEGTPQMPTCSRWCDLARCECCKT
jgi:hypothetical protein